MKKKQFVVAAAAGLAATAMFASVAAAAEAPAKMKYAEHYKTPGAGDWSPGSTLTWANGAVTAVEGSTSSYFGATTLPGSANRLAWPSHGYVAQLDVYLDPAAMQVGHGFDLSVASSKYDGTYGRDFIFNVGMTASGGLRVAGSNNSSFKVNDSVLLASGSAELTTAGWYTFQHEFYNNGDGTLAVDLNVVNKDGVQVFHTTRNASDSIAEAGGPRYQWFTFIDGAIQFDNQRLFLKN